MVSKETLEARKQWVVALRSGKYEQGKGWLRSKNRHENFDRYCCLGVAAELFFDGVPKEVPEKCKEYIVQYEGVSNALPRTVEDTLQIIGGGVLNDPILFGKDEKYYVYALWQLNDLENMSFNDIADIIEEQFIKPYEESND